MFFILMKYRAFLFAVGYLLILYGRSEGSDSPSFYVEGTLVDEIIRDGEVVSASEFRFDAWVDSPSWTIRVYDLDQDNELSYGAYGSDGKNVYHYGWDQASISEEPERSSVVGWVNEGHVPKVAHQRPFLVWFAYCSLAYFETVDESRLIPAPWALPRMMYVSSATDPRISFLSSGLPRESEFILTDEAKEESLRQGWVHSHFIERAEAQLAEFPDGFRLGSYRVEEIEMFEGIELPRIATSEVYSLSESGSTEGWLDTVYTLSLSEIQVGDRDGVGGPIEIPKGYSVSMHDTRLKDPETGIDFASYRWQDEEWPTEIPDEAFVAFEQQRERRSMELEFERDIDRSPAIWLIGVMLGFGLIPVVILLLKK